MIFGPWVENDSSPGGRKVNRLFGIRVSVTWLEIKAAWRKLFNRGPFCRSCGAQEPNHFPWCDPAYRVVIILPTGDNESGE
jgi:hypothetical protein